MFSRYPAAMRSLSDTWHGRFAYAGGIPQPENSFVATLLQAGAAITGAVHEIHNHGPHAGALLTAALMGTVDGSSVSFRKTYDPLSSPDGFAEVRYDGTLDAEQAEIAGSWRIADVPPNGSDITGRFVMIRANRRAFSTAAGIAVSSGDLIPIAGR